MNSNPQIKTQSSLHCHSTTKLTKVQTESQTHALEERRRTMLRHLNKSTGVDVDAEEERKRRTFPSTLFVHVLVYGQISRSELLQTKTVLCTPVLLNWSGLSSLPCWASCFLYTVLCEIQ